MSEGGGAPAPAPPGPAAWRSRLWRRYAAVIVTLCVVLIAAYGGAEMMVSFSAAKEQAGRLQAAEAGEAALALHAALVNVDRHVAAVNELPWQPGWLGLDTRREEFARLLRVVPAAEAIAWRSAAGHEVLNVSRRDTDRVSVPPGAAPAPAAPASGVRPQRSYGKLRYSADLEPVLDIEVPDPEGSAGGSTVVRLALRALVRELRATLSVPGADVYAVERGGVIVLHRDPLVMLSRAAAPFDPALLPQVPVAASAPANGAALAAEGAAVVAFGRGLQGAEVLRAAVPVTDLGWFMVVERPRAEVMAPARASVLRATLFLALGVVVAMTAALLLADRLSRPVRLLHRAAAQVEQGQLDTQISIRTKDELEDLATQFNRMAASLRASVNELEAKVAARTRELQAANRHKSDFLANMSHELRTPLNAILGFADVLREGMAGELNDAQREYIGDIRDSGLHLLALINDVLDLSKIEAGQLVLEYSEFDVPGTVDAALTLVRQRAVAKGLTLTVVLAPEVGTWFADERRLKQVLVNLLGNAVKFTPAGGTVSLHGGVDAVQGLWLEVRDDGIGIAEADHETVFQEFRQVGGVGRAEGTGLGLALVRRFVRQHGGEVALHSSLGAGAVFRFNLPAAAQSDHEPR